MTGLAKPVTERDHVRGPWNAPVTLVEYADFECPFCARAYPVLRELEQRFPIELRVVFRHNPLGRLHPHAHLAAQASEAAALQRAFWPMHDSLFEHSEALAEANLVELARDLGLAIPRFLVDMHSSAVGQRVREDELSAVASRVIGTPTLFINGARFEERPGIAELTQAVQQAYQPE